LGYYGSEMLFLGEKLNCVHASIGYFAGRSCPGAETLNDKNIGVTARRRMIQQGRAKELSVE